MIRNRLLLKSITVFLILETLFSTVAPTISWALTAGPTAPEATSFEPVDTTDIVNLATGDMAYNIPLLEVPGPSGGYPLSLSYHAGIQPNEDASWTGLGFTLNPGAISRNVNGFADDHSNVQNSSRLFWEGGETRTYTVGVTVGIAGTVASVTAGLSYSQDTYMGCGVGASVGVGAQLFDGGSLGVSAGVSPYGDPEASVGLSVSVKGTEKLGLGLTTGAGLRTNFKSVSAYGNAGLSIGYRNNGRNHYFNAFNASISTGSNGGSNMSASGVSVASSGGSGRVSRFSNGITVPIPIFYGVSITLGYRYQRYWIDQYEKTNVNGALYYTLPSNPDDIFQTQYFTDNAFDTYSLPDQNLQLQSDDKANPDKSLGGSFPSYDNYYVNAQGLFGAMRPYYFQKHLSKRNNYSKNDDGGRDFHTIQYDLARNQTKENKRAEFRFINDFSNRFEYTPDRIHHLAAPYPDPSMQYHFESGTDLRAGENGTDSYESNLVQGSRSVQWFTNEEIINKAKRVTDAGFIETVSSGYTRGTSNNILKPKQIGGFTIVNESGVKYHFALPAYSYDDYIYSERKSADLTYNEFYKRDPYAYTWYLTAITGPDYVDRGSDGNADGKLNEFDWGYWVEFEYGKWTDIYAWRNPSEGMDVDIDKNFQNFSEGRKELYYLDAIRTKTHTALFFKDIRDDAKSSLHFERNISHTYSGKEKRKEEIINETRRGGFTPKAARCACSTIFTQSAGQHQSETFIDNGTLDYYSLPTSTLKLNSIILIDNKSLKTVPVSKSDGEEYSQKTTSNWNVSRDDALPAGKENCNFSPLVADHHLYKNVLDIYDLANVKDALNSVSLRSLKFNTDYSLSPETPNSFDYKLITSNPSVDDSAYPKNGKLTLKNVQFLGKGGADLMPAIQFNYDLENPVRGSGVLTESSGAYTFYQTNSGLVPGDILAFESNNNAAKKYYAVVTSIADNAHTLQILGKNLPVSGSFNYRTTKNPPYNKDAFDMWGLYKSDYVNTSNIYMDRIVTETSAKTVDAWSLRDVTLSLGGKLQFDYQADDYNRAAINGNYEFSIHSIKESAEPNVFDVFLNAPSQPRRRLNVGDDLYLSFLYMKTINKKEVTCQDQVQQFSDLVFKGDGIIREKISDSPGFIHLKVESSALEKVFRSYTYRENGCDHPVNYTFTYGYTIPLNRIGGGIRVSAIRLSDMGKIRETTYDYTQNGNSTGGTSYEPNIWERGTDAYYNFDKDNKLGEGHNLLSIAREVPSPGVIYEYVTVKERVIESGVEQVLPNYTTYNFEVFTPGMAGAQYMSDETTTFSRQTYEDYISYNKKQTRTVVLKDYTSRVGALKAVKLYNAQGEPISETQNHFLHDGITASLINDDNDRKVNDELEANIEHYETNLQSKFNNQGVIEETYTDARFISREGDDFALQGVVSKREQFPSVMTGQTVINYKTGIKTSTVNTAFDYYSGQVVESISYDGYGNAYQTKITPAYRQYPQMGLASSGGKNMLTQEAASYAYKIDPAQSNKKLGLVSASVQTWSDQIVAMQPGKNLSESVAQSGIWRKSAGFTFIGMDDVALLADGLFPADQVASFNAWNVNDIASTGWQRNGNITLYDVNSHALEATDVNGKYAATRMSFDQTVVMATVANAEYQEFGYSGAEDRPQNDLFGTDVYQNSNQYTSNAHTGYKALIASAGNRAFTFYLKPKQRTYRVSVWSSEPSCTMKYTFDNGSANSSVVRNKGKAGSWYLLETDIAVNEQHNKLEIWCEPANSTTYFDDFRIKPVDAAMTSYVYNKWGELSHILDNNNLYSEYRYDQAGRLQSTYKESFQREYGTEGVVKTGENRYNYGSNKSFMITLTASSTGSRGYIYPSGTSSVIQGKDITFELRDKCQYNTLGAVLIDGKKIDLGKPTTKLQDGTVLLVQAGGKAVTFQKVQSAHTIRADFASNSIAGVVECNSYMDANGNTCYEGGYKYAYYDVCGNLGTWTEVSRKAQIPSDLSALATNNCCVFNTSNTTCICKPGSTNTTNPE